MNKYIPKFSFKTSDGGKTSGVNGYLFFEWKPFFSFGFLRFNKGSRDNYHSHAFNALTWWLKGEVLEEKYNGHLTRFLPSIKPKYTSRDNVHRVIAEEITWAFTVRGPWENDWFEIDPNGNKIKMTHGRKVIGD